MKAIAETVGEICSRRDVEAYFVGGCVRDCLLGLPVKDLDIIAATETFPLARELARALGGSPFWLREEDQAVRVALPGQESHFLDVLPLRGSLAGDLRRRDLTINALAMPVAGGLDAGGTVLDVTGGRRDLLLRQIRFTSPGVERADPLRVLRAIRFRWQLGFRYAPGVTGRIRAAAPSLASVSAERVRDEIFLMLEPGTAARAAADVARLGAWPAFPVLAAPQGSVPPNPGLAIRMLDRRLGRAARLPDGERLRGWLAGTVSPPRSRLALLRLAAALLPPIEAGPGEGPTAVAPGPHVVGRILALSRREAGEVAGSMEHARAFDAAARRWLFPGRELLRLLTAAGGAAVGASILATLVPGWTPEHQQLLAAALRWQEQPLRPLVTGAEVMRICRLPSGPEVGRTLARLLDEQADGNIRTPEEARAWLANLER